MIVWKFVDNNSKVICCHSVCFGFCKERDLKHDAVEKLLNTLLYGPVVKDGRLSYNIGRDFIYIFNKHKFGQVNRSFEMKS